YKSVVDENHQIRRKGEQSVYEIEIYKKNKERIWVIISGAPFFDLDGNVVGSIGIHFDITKQKRLQNELIAAKEIAEKAQIAEQKFLASMSHEIRTPLNAVIGMSHLLNDTLLTDEQKEYVTMMQYSANLLRNLVTDVLDFAKIESGELEVQNKPFDLVGLLKTLQKTYELKLSSKPVKVNFNIPNIDYFVNGDETLINQVLYNLLGNAEKFTSQGEISLTSGIKDLNEENSILSFQVKDTGIGIDKEKLSDIFEEFKQESRETSIKFGGTGLGLSITKKILTTLGGTIEVESEKGIGTTFFVQIPIVKSKRNIYAQNEVSSTSLASKSSVLVLEDNVVNQNYIKRILQKENIEFDIASNGKEGFEMAKSKEYGLIFMDISMPEMDGYEATIAIRNYAGPNQDTPIIALTASAMLNKKDKAFELGMNDYMTKPFTPSELQAILGKYLTSQKVVETHHDIYANEQLLDQSTLNMFYEGDNEYALEMFSLFSENYPDQIQSLKAFLNENNFEEAQKIVHKMKPTFSMVGAPSIQNAFQILEDKLRFKDQLGVETEWKNAQVLLDEFIPAIESELKRLKELSSS
ncbi:MAG: response regulator, partial [Schleiferiaceae bacterium]|nr:response regulator [Schleiferiaceae bacterium]